MWFYITTNSRDYTRSSFNSKGDIIWYLWNGNIIHININDYDGTYNIGDVLNCITDKGEVNYTIIEKYYNNIIVDKVSR